MQDESEQMNVCIRRHRFEEIAALETASLPKLAGAYCCDGLPPMYGRSKTIPSVFEYRLRIARSRLPLPPPMSTISFASLKSYESRTPCSDMADVLCIALPNCSPSAA